MFLGCLSGCSLLGPNLNDFGTNNVRASTGSRLVASTQAELESDIYNYISNRILVGESLVDVSAKDKKNIQALLTNVNQQLVTSSPTGPLSDSMLNYLLLEFAQTPYEWYQSAFNIVGRDVATRFLFVDVVYNTADSFKNIVADSKIPNGAPMEQSLKEQRYKDYVAMLNFQFSGNSKYGEAANTFISRWGAVADIMAEQQGDSLATRTSRFYGGGGIGRLTYSGLMSSATQNKPATMTIRFIMKYDLNLGEETELVVDQLYLKEYKILDKDSLLSTKNLEGVSTIEPFMRNVITRYHRCVEESNDIGLYTLFTNYGKIDKYYLDMREYSYSAFGGFTIKPLVKDGRYVTALITRVNQSRMRGIDMSMPTYKEELLCTFYLDSDDTIKIKDIIPISRVLVGEPRSIIKNISGISEQLTYDSSVMSKENIDAILNKIAEFEQLVVNGDYSSDAFLNVVDLGVSDYALTTIVSNIRALNPSKLAAYVLSWETKTNVYSVVNIRECFEVKGETFTTEAKIGLAMRDNKWSVISYNRSFITKGESLIDESKALCVVKPTQSNKQETKSLEEQETKGSNEQETKSLEELEEQETESLDKQEIESSGGQEIESSDGQETESSNEQETESSNE